VREPSTQSPSLASVSGKSNSPGSFVTSLVVIGTVAILGGFGYLLLQAIHDAPTVVGSFVTALGAVVAVVAGRVWEKRQELEQTRRDRIAPIYSRLVEVFYKSMDGKAKTHELEAFFHEWARQVILFGPEPVIKEYAAWKQALPDDGEEATPAATFGFERLLYAIRADLGNRRGSLTEGDLLRVFVNDVDEYLAQHHASLAEPSTNG
jgi:hypothetical protein